MHQLDRMEEMLAALNTALCGGDDARMSKHDVCELVTGMFRAVRDGRKIEAIKAHRTLTGYGLKESKDEIESIKPSGGPVY